MYSVGRTYFIFYSIILFCFDPKSCGRNQYYNFIAIFIDTVFFICTLNQPSLKKPKLKPKNDILNNKIGNLIYIIAK